jgi:signal transduction histidine kinase
MRTVLQKQSDRLLAVGFAAASAVEILIRGVEHLPVIMTIGLLVAGSLAWRVRLPIPVLAVNLAGSLALELISGPDDYPATLGLVLLVAIYTAAAHTRDREEAVAGGLLVASVPILSGAHALDYDLGDPSGRTNTFIGSVFLVISFRAAWLLGKWVQRLRAKQRARVAEREDRARAALREERARIARELHDVLAHAISVVVLQARGARHALAREPEDAREPIDAIEQTATQALGEMRRLLTVLRADEDGATLAPQPSIARMEPLVGSVRAAGLPVELRIEGTARELPPGVDLCAYRIVQEALTNSLKHAGPATAQVLLRYDDEAIDVEIADTGAGTVNGDAVGLGLAGMRERVALFGGRLESGPRPEGGYVVRARLPL